MRSRIIASNVSFRVHGPLKQGGIPCPDAIYHNALPTRGECKYELRQTTCKTREVCCDYYNDKSFSISFAITSLSQLSYGPMNFVATFCFDKLLPLLQSWLGGILDIEYLVNLHSYCSLRRGDLRNRVSRFACINFEDFVLESTRYL